MRMCCHVEGNVETAHGDLHAACGRTAVCGQRAVGALHLGQSEKQKKQKTKKKSVSETLIPD